MPRASERGEFEPFKMLIGAIMALVVLTIILGAIDFFGSWTVNVSTERLFTGIRNAVHQPNGNPLEIRGLAFEEGTVYTTSAIGRQVGLEAECLKFWGPENYSSLTWDHVEQKTLAVNNRFETSVYAVCNTNNSSSECAANNCEVCCDIYFATEPA